MTSNKPNVINIKKDLLSHMQRHDINKKIKRVAKNDLGVERAINIFLKRKFGKRSEVTVDKYDGIVYELSIMPKFGYCTECSDIIQRVEGIKVTTCDACLIPEPVTKHPHLKLVGG